MANGNGNGNGGGVGWKVVAYAACGIVTLLAAAWADKIDTRVEKNTTNISSMMQTLTRIETTVNRIDKSLP